MNGSPRTLLDPRLYLVLDPTVMRGKPVEQILEDAVRGGVTVVQVREKHCSNSDFLGLARRAAAVLKRLSIPLILNDRVDAVLELEVQGVHLGQSDLHWSEARRKLGPEAIIGISVENFFQATELVGADVDYLGVSSVFPTATKKDVAEVWGLERLAQLRKQSHFPLVGIGGIDATNAQSVMAAGANGIAVVSAICAAPSPRKAAMELRQIVERAG
ncbi:MAG TPA: thiamine phosphate synthase [Bdellovibrionota bacterium]|jgi:thiamine-phosphate pyrophosphorylase